MTIPVYNQLISSGKKLILLLTATLLSVHFSFADYETVSTQKFVDKNLYVKDILGDPKLFSGSTLLVTGPGCSRGKNAEDTYQAIKTEIKKTTPYDDSYLPIENKILTSIDKQFESRKRINESFQYVICNGSLRKVKNKNLIHYKYTYFKSKKNDFVLLLYKESSAQPNPQHQGQLIVTSKGSYRLFKSEQECKNWLKKLNPELLKDKDIKRLSFEDSFKYMFDKIDL